jgi:hypothetical protein
MSKSKEEKSQEWMKGIYPCCDTSHKQGVKCPIHEKNKTSKVDEKDYKLLNLIREGVYEILKGETEVGTDTIYRNVLKWKNKELSQAKTSLRKMIEGLKLGCICARKECICEAKKHNEVIDKVLNLFK